MQLLILSKQSKKVLNFTFGPVLGVITVLIVVLGGMALFLGGVMYSKNITHGSIRTLYSQNSPFWDKEIEVQRSIIEEARQNAEKNLDALASRLSKLQAHVMRLDALGSRLADMAQLDDIDFAVNSVPGIGGTDPDAFAETLKVNDFIKSLDELSIRLNDRGEKLAAMESMLIDRTLQELTIPEGQPTREGWLSSLFGFRTDPITGKRTFHQGIDFAGKPGTKIMAAGSGIVTWSDTRQGYGNVVEINHGNGYQTIYAHNKKNLVEVGQKVEKGDVIAVMGNTGRSTGTHLHFEVLHNGKYVNPNRYIDVN